MVSAWLKRVSGDSFDLSGGGRSQDSKARDLVPETRHRFPTPHLTIVTDRWEDERNPLLDSSRINGYLRRYGARWRGQKAAGNEVGQRS